MNYIGIDIGGTNIRVGEVDCLSGNITCLVKERATEGVKTADDFLKKVIDMVEKIPSHKNCKAIGIGVPGMVVDGKITTCRNLKVLVGFSLDKCLEKHFGKPVYIQNDAKVAALGEALCGAGKGGTIVAYVGLGTGLGGGVVINGQLYLGSSNLGGYFSRIILDGDNIAESLVAGVGLNAQIKEAFSEEITLTDFFNLLSCGKNQNTHKVAIALKVLERFKKNLVNLLLNISVTLNPDIIVLGGGIMDSAQYFLNDVKKCFKKCAHEQALNTKIAHAALKYPGVTGAALFAVTQNKTN